MHRRLAVLFRALGLPWRWCHHLSRCLAKVRVVSIGRIDLSKGTDCSGLETPVLALQALQFPCTPVFARDSDVAVERHMQQNFSPSVWFDDLIRRSNSSPLTPAVDLHSAGLPCQPIQRGREAAGGSVVMGPGLYQVQTASGVCSGKCEAAAHARQRKDFQVISSHFLRHWEWRILIA